MNSSLVTFDQYLERCPEDHHNIVYIFAPDKEAGMKSPYLESISSDTPILFINSPVDEMIMTQISSYNDKTVISAER